MITVGPSAGSTIFVPIALAPFLAFFLWLALTGQPAALAVVAILGLVIVYLTTVRLVLADGTLTLRRWFVRRGSVPVSTGQIKIIDGSGWPQFCMCFEGKQWCVSTGEFNLDELRVLMIALERSPASEG
jgi:hypothetical protein